MIAKDVLFDLFFFLFFFLATWEILVPQPGIESGPQLSKHLVLTTGPPGSPLLDLFYYNSLLGLGTNTRILPTAEYTIPIIHFGIVEVNIGWVCKCQDPL